MCQFFNQRTLVLNRCHPIEFRFDRSKCFFVHRLFVHAGSIEIADALIDTVAARAASRRLFQNAAFDAEVTLVEFSEAPPGRPVGGNFGFLQPVAAGVLIKVHAGIDGLIDVVDTEAIVGLRGGRRLGETANSGTNHENKNKEKTETAHNAISWGRLANALAKTSGNSMPSAVPRTRVCSTPAVE